MEDNKRFWSRCAGIYEIFVKSGKRAQEAYAQMEDLIRQYLNKDMAVLELAAGPGILSKHIAKACRTLEATDFSEEMIKKAKKSKVPDNVHFTVADATNLIYQDQQFDAVVMANALHIMPYPEEAIKEIRRVLKPNGILIAPTFTRKDMKYSWKERVMESVGFKTYSKWTHKSYQDFLRKQGWRICVQQVITGHNFPISFIVCKYNDIAH